MEYSAYQLLWLFLCYAFLGWLCETALAAARKRRLLNRGFLNVPFSPVYGLGGVLFAIFLSELRDDPFFLFLGGMILATALELFTGILLEKLTGQKWWDYSGRRFQFEGHISLTYSVIWGLAAVFNLFVGNRLILALVGLIPVAVGRIILLVVYIVLGLDVLTSLAALFQWKLSLPDTRQLSRFLRALTQRLDNAVTRYIQRRVVRAYPNLDPARGKARAKKKATVFAQGCCFYKLACLFFLGAFLGDIIETIFCRLTAGVWMSRSSVVWGPFSIVWGLALAAATLLLHKYRTRSASFFFVAGTLLGGLGAVLLTALLYKYRRKSDGYLFFVGTVAGGAYEYFCSVFTELVFGTVFWDYSKIPFNLGGRINLLYCFFWGIAAVIWLKVIYPVLSGWIEKLPIRAGKSLTWVLILFMLVNVILSALAMGRFVQRQGNPAPADNALGRFLDERFPDERMERIYPNIVFVE